MCVVCSLSLTFYEVLLICSFKFAIPYFNFEDLNCKTFTEQERYLLILHFLKGVTNPLIHQTTHRANGHGVKRSYHLHGDFHNHFYQMMYHNYYNHHHHHHQMLILFLSQSIDFSFQCQHLLAIYFHQLYQCHQ